LRFLRRIEEADVLIDRLSCPEVNPSLVKTFFNDQMWGKVNASSDALQRNASTERIVVTPPNTVDAVVRNGIEMVSILQNGTAKGSDSAKLRLQLLSQPRKATAVLFQKQTSKSAEPFFNPRLLLSLPTHHCGSN
jgi:hypothetical protein